jgi:hypothetical protein
MTPNPSCGTCALCCKLPRVVEINKPQGRWCEHCRPGQNGACSIFDRPERPTICGEYLCVWRMTDLPAELRPDRCGFIINSSASDKKLVAIMVDPNRPEAWRRGPGKLLIDKLTREGMRVLIMCGDKRKLLTGAHDPVTIRFGAAAPHPALRGNNLGD